MAQEICGVSQELMEKLHIFRHSKQKTLGAILMKINKAKMLIEIEEEWEETTIEEIENEVPPQQPRYIAIIYPLKHDDGRMSYPMLFVYICPQGCSPELHMMYAGSKQTLVTTAGFTKTMELRSLEEFTDENVRAALMKK